jgi:hypothetical protein
MKIAGIRELRAQAAALLGGDEPLLVTKHGKIFGVYLPLDEPDTIPADLRRELSAVLGRHLAKLAARQGVTERQIEKDFDAHRRRRRGR